MAQGDVLRLMREDKWITANEVFSRVQCNRSSVNTNLKKLYDSGDVERRFKKIDDDYDYREFEYRLLVVPDQLI